MKINIELTEDQLSLIINSLEATFRLMMQQGHIVADILAECPDKNMFTNEEKWKRDFQHYLITRECASYQLNALAKTLYGTGEKPPRNTNRISDMWSAFRHLQYNLHPHEGYDVRSGRPFSVSDYPMIKIDLIENESQENDTKKNRD